MSDCTLCVSLPDRRISHEHLSTSPYRRRRAPHAGGHCFLPACGPRPVQQGDSLTAKCARLGAGDRSQAADVAAGHDYFRALDKASPRVSVRTLGKTTGARLHRRLHQPIRPRWPTCQKYQRIQRKLMDPRLRTAAELPRLLDEGKNVILITSSIHSTEVGGFLTPFVLADRLARGNSPEVRSILPTRSSCSCPRRTLTGWTSSGNWYRSTLDTPAEGVQAAGALPLLHGARQQPRLVRLHAARDALHGGLALHAVGPADRERRAPAGAQRGAHLHPAVHGSARAEHRPDSDCGTNALGMAMAWRMIAEGKTGVATNASYDQWSPARQYSLNASRGAHPHRDGECASGDGDQHPVQRLGTGRGYDAKVQSWNFPAIWQGGRWGIGDIVQYQSSASWALLAQAARDRLVPGSRATLTMGERALAAEHPVDDRLDRPHRLRDSQRTRRTPRRCSASSGRCSMGRWRFARRRRRLRLAADAAGRQLCGGRFDSRSARTPRRCSNRRSIPTCASIRAVRRSARTTSRRTRCRCCSVSMRFRVRGEGGA
jgi:hypothetical protein